MKLKHLFPELASDSNIIASFGGAKLLRKPDGSYEVKGGSKEDRAQAGEWISLFMHEVVISR